MTRRQGTLLSMVLVAALLSAAKVSQAQLRIDIDDRGASDPANTEPGFEQFLLGGTENDEQATTTRMFGDIEVTIAHSNTAVGMLYGDRRRSEPTNAGAFTDQELLRDFLFARGETPDDGLDITVDNLEADKPYRVRV